MTLELRPGGQGVTYAELVVTQSKQREKQVSNMGMVLGCEEWKETRKARGS